MGSQKLRASDERSTCVARGLADGSGDNDTFVTGVNLACVEVGNPKKKRKKIAHHRTTTTTQKMIPRQDYSRHRRDTN